MRKTPKPGKFAIGSIDQFFDHPQLGHCDGMPTGVTHTEQEVMGFIKAYQTILGDFLNFGKFVGLYDNNGDQQAVEFNWADHPFKTHNEFVKAFEDYSRRKLGINFQDHSEPYFLDYTNPEGEKVIVSNY